MGCFHTVLVFSHFINLAISLQRQNIRTPKFVLLYKCILSISTQIFRAIPHIFVGQFTDQCCSTYSTVLFTIKNGQMIGKKKSHKTDICHQVTRRVYQCKIECKTKELLHEKRGRDKIRYQFKLRMTRPFWENGPTGFFRYPRVTKV